MKGQTGLFDFESSKPRKAPSAKLARRSDPATSKAAAEEIVPQLGGLQAWALDQIARYPGLTVNEIAERIELRDPRQLGRRLNELEKMGKIQVLSTKRCSITNRKCQVYGLKGEQ